MCWGIRCSGQLLQAVKQLTGAIFPWQTEGRVVRWKEGAMRSPHGARRVPAQRLQRELGSAPERCKRCGSLLPQASPRGRG